jgi:hypothetical protein
MIMISLIIRDFLISNYYFYSKYLLQNVLKRCKMLMKIYNMVV